MASKNPAVAFDETSGSTLASSVYDRLRGDILRGELTPGQKLRLESLRDRYGAGSSPIREALNRLSSDGLVIREDQKGFRVADVSGDDLSELIRTRCWIEEVALRESIANGGTEWEEGIVLAFHRLSRVPQSASDDGYAVNPEWEERHRDFHRSLISACGSRLLLQYCEQLMALSDRYRLLAIRVSYPARDEEAEHKAIMEAALDRNTAEAVKLLHSHFTFTSEIISDRVKQFPSGR